MGRSQALAPSRRRSPTGVTHRKEQKKVKRVSGRCRSWQAHSSLTYRPPRVRGREHGPNGCLRASGKVRLCDQRQTNRGSSLAAPDSGLKAPSGSMACAGLGMGRSVGSDALLILTRLRSPVHTKFSLQRGACTVARAGGHRTRWSKATCVWMTLGG
ncbi:hypothetical protein OH77DRAFT_1312278 [Trametes cingulata]|nr:hypothetical protein OH77DRAFT_1312278 [Trametes cingulata]